MHGRLLKVHILNLSDTYFVSNQNFLSTIALFWLKLFALFTGKSKDEAMSDYITKVKHLLEEAAT
jgi:hypothetical protein